MYIYTIRSKSNDFFIYIGSTTQQLNRRWNGHKLDCKRKTSHLYNFMLNNGGIENYYIELYEEFNGTKEELRKREGEIIREFKQKSNDYYVLNHRIECRNQQEYYQDNKNKILEKKQIYYQENKDKKQQYYQDNRDVKLEYQKNYMKNKKLIEV